MEESSDAITSQVTSRRVALLSCGTFSPPTYMHLRMFERARDYLKKIHGWEVVEGIMSPVADSIGRPDMIPAKHRLKMVQLIAKSSSWIRADGWECAQGEWIRTIHVLHYFKEVLNRKYKNGNCQIRLLLLCGGDVIESITKLAVSGGVPWDAKQIEEVVRDFGVVVVMRANTDPVSAIYLADVLNTYQKNIFVIEDETCPNDISSTRLRTAIRRKESIRYCTSDEVIQYIEDNSLYGATSLPTIHPKLSVLPLKQTVVNTEGENHKALSDHSSEMDEKQLHVLELSPIWCPSTCLPRCSLLTEEFVNSTRSLSHLQKTVPALAESEQCLSEATSFTTVPKQCRHAHFRSLESRDYHNSNLDGMLATSSNCADCLAVEKDVPFECSMQMDVPTTSQLTNMCNEQANSQIKMQAAAQKRQNCETLRRRSTGYSRSVGNLAAELLLEKEDKSRSLSHVRCEGSDEGNNVTLIYRKYKLASTPETTV
ncbi:unnamed protein product [Litomosoides sigmodontis]|uniref:Nicotinamide/nicotinic acid mononucleotide adenylyltransferase 3 n=1 Tax=Litomosoides sigmodontis TaxID=42156 RepID=A0A3P6UX35_LITSI|nr:unnamed protein product [Litomosoides sigmodontis]